MIIVLGGDSVENITYKIIKRFGVLSENESGWKREFNLVSWNDAKPKYDIRQWAPDGIKMSKGLTMTEDEIKILRNLIDEDYLSIDS